MADFFARTAGQWPQILAGLCALTEEQLTNKHQSCPNCGGEDRYRCDSIEGSLSWFCNQCGGKDRGGGGGNGVDMVMRLKDCNFREAVKLVDEFLGVAPKPTKDKAGFRPFRAAEKPPSGVASPSLGRAVAQWCYRDAAGEQLFWVQRVNGGKAGKFFLLVIWLDGAWHTVSKNDPFRADWIEPRPLYRLPDLIERPDAPVVVAEGEKCADAAAELLPEHVAIGFRNGASSASKSDWSPLKGREVILLPDNDGKGAEFVDRVTAELRKAGAASVAVCSPPDDAPEKWDIWDAMHVDGWSAMDAQMWLGGAVEAECEGEAEAEPTYDAGHARWDAFVLLGFDQGHYFYHPEGSGQIVGLPSAGHIANNLYRLAPLKWWQGRWPKYNKDGDVIGADWAAVNSDLIEAQHKVGVFDPDRIRGAGVWLDAGTPVMHLGDRLVINGTVRDVRDGPLGSDFIYDKSKRIEGDGGVAPLDDEGGLAILMLASRFNWEEPSAGMLLAGWTFLATICGALDWRPHVWLTAAAGSGKSTVLTRFLGVLLGDFAVVPVGASTEAGIRQKLASAARPVIFDEAESNEEEDKKRIQRILDSARVSSSRGVGEVLKGTVGGSGMNFSMRSMFLFCSIATALKNNADKTRFAVLTLQSATEALGPAAAAKQWREIEAELARVATDANGKAMIARAFTMVNTIREAIEVFTTACTIHLGTQRLGDQYGVLCAGAWCLCNSKVPTEEDAAAWLESYPLVVSAEESRTEPDEELLEQTILQSQVRVDLAGSGSQTRTLSELADLAAGWAGSPLEPVGPDDAAKALGRHGLKVKPDGVVAPDGTTTGPALLLATTSKSLKTILKGTPWANCWPRVLLRLAKSTRGGNHRFHGLGVSKSVAIALEPPGNRPER